MPRPLPRAVLFPCLWLLLGAPASAAPHPSDAPVRLALHDDAPGLPDDDTPDTQAPSRSDVLAQLDPAELPASPEAWVAHGGVALLPLGGAWGASRVGGDTRLAATASETAAGMLLGALPSHFLFLRPNTPGGGRWMDLEVLAFGAGLVLTPPLAALGTWSLGELAFGRSHDRADAYLGALGGAASGTLLAAALDGLLTKLAEPSARLKGARHLICLALIGASTTVGYQWARGGPRANPSTR